MENFFKKVLGYDIIFYISYDLIIRVIQTDKEDRSGEMIGTSDKIYNI